MKSLKLYYATAVSVVFDYDVTDIKLWLREFVRETRRIILNLLQRRGGSSGNGGLRAGVMFYSGRFLCSTKNRRAQNNERGGEKF